MGQCQVAGGSGAPEDFVEMNSAVTRDIGWGETRQVDTCG